MRGYLLSLLGMFLIPSVSVAQELPNTGSMETVAAAQVSVAAWAG